MPHMFISYAREDQTMARALADLLDSEGFEVWWDAEIYAGQSFPDLIEDAIRASRHVIVLWSKHSVESEWVIREVGLAKKDRKLLPVLLEGVAHDDLPKQFRDIHCIQYRGWAPLLRELQRAVPVFGVDWQTHTVQEVPAVHSFIWDQDSARKYDAFGLVEIGDRVRVISQCVINGNTIIQKGVARRSDR